MGVDLTLLPALDSRANAAHDTLFLERRSELFERILELDSWPIQGVHCYLARSANSEDTYGEAIEDSYGAPLRSVTVAELLKLSADDGVRDNWRNRAVWAYLGQLPRTWPIVLFWS